MDKICATYEQRKRGANETFGQEVEVTALFVGPFALDKVVQERADYWRARLEEEYSLRLNLKVALPPFQTDDIECKGYWLNPNAKTYEKRVKSLRSQVNSALIEFLSQVERLRPRIIIGLGQGAVVTAMSSFHQIMERACRDRAATRRLGQE